MNTTSELSALKRDLKKFGGDVLAERQALGEGGPPLGPDKNARLAFERVLLSWEVERLNRQIKQQEDFGNDLLAKIQELEEEKGEELALVRAALEEKERSHQRLGGEFADLSGRYLEERMLAEARIGSLEAEVTDLKHQTVEMGVKEERLRLTVAGLEEQLEVVRRKGEEELAIANERNATLKKTHEDQLKVALTRHLESLSVLQREMDQRTNQLAMERTVLLSETSRSVQRLREEADVLKENLSKARAEHKGELFAKQVYFEEQVGTLKQQLTDPPTELRSKDEEIRSLQASNSEWEARCRALEAQVAQMTSAMDRQARQLKEQVRSAAEDGHLQAELEDLQKKLSSKTKAEAELRATEEALRTERDKLATQLRAERHRLESAENEVADLRRALRTANAQAAKLGEQATAAQAEVQLLESRLAQAASNADFYRKKFEAVQEDNATRTAEFREKLESVKKMELKYYDAIDRLNKAS